MILTRVTYLHQVRHVALVRPRKFSARFITLASILMIVGINWLA